MLTSREIWEGTLIKWAIGLALMPVLMLSQCVLEGRLTPGPETPELPAIERSGGHSIPTKEI